MLPVAAMGLGAVGAFLLSHVDIELTETAFPVPVESVTRKQWGAFVRVCANGNPRTVTPSFRLGLFEITVRRLCDLEAMTNPRLIRFKDRQVWDADWATPSSLRAFHDDPTLQYRLFSDSIGRYAVDAILCAHVGCLIDGGAMTLSGALIVAHRAGLPGLSSWSTNPKERAKFSKNTTGYYERGNGLF